MPFEDFMQIFQYLLPIVFVVLALLIFFVFYCMNARLKVAEDSEGEAQVAEEDQ